MDGVVVWCGWGKLYLGKLGRLGSCLAGAGVVVMRVPA